MNRQLIIKELRSQSEKIWDIIIIGGGATGLGLALDGASRGYKILLLEQSDFASGTSSRSTKLVHGGVRYMAQGDLFLVVEALRERGILLKNAPHLTFDQEFIIPVYSLADAIKYTIGLKFYDLLSGKLSMGKSRFINREETMVRLPLLNKEGLKGGVVYHDGQFDDSRLALALAQRSIEKGANVINYCRVTGFLKNDKNKIRGVEATDKITRENFVFQSKLVINATGVFADDIARMDDPLSKTAIKPSQGVHIVFNKSFLQSDSALMIPKTDDGRVLFAIPWYDEVVVGTTDTPLDSISQEPVALESEINFILQNVKKYFTKIPARKDILSVFAGLRPLAADPDNATSTREISRRHKITLSGSGLLSIIGGKWTTYRRMAEETIDHAIKIGFLEKRKCVTRNLTLMKFPENVTKGRLQIYGDGSAEIEKMIIDNPELGKRIDAALPYTTAEIMWICRNEMPCSIEDVLARRTRAIFLNSRKSAAMAPEIARIMAKEFGYDSEWQKNQIISYNKLIINYI